MCYDQTNITTASVNGADPFRPRVRVIQRAVDHFCSAVDVITMCYSSVLSKHAPFGEADGWLACSGSDMSCFTVTNLQLLHSHDGVAARCSTQQ